MAHNMRSGWFGGKPLNYCITSMENLSAPENAAPLAAEYALSWIVPEVL